MHTCHGSWLAALAAEAVGRSTGGREGWGGVGWDGVAAEWRRGGKAGRQRQGEGKREQKSWSAVSIINDSLVYGERDLMCLPRL